MFRKLQQALSAIRSQYGVKRIGIFGSFARGEQKRTSDIDVLVVFEPERKTFKNFAHLIDFLEDLFHRKVDLLTEESLNRIRPYVEQEVIWIEG